MVSYPIFGIIGAVMVMFSIVLGAYGAHGLDDVFGNPKDGKVLGNAVDYQMFHGLALLFLESSRLIRKKQNYG